MWYVIVVLNKHIDMKYIIRTLNSEHVLATIIEGVENNKDENGSSIDTWSIKTVSNGRKVLVHTAPAWEHKGCIILSSNSKVEEISASFHYWANCNEEDRHPDDDKYMLGRFTELMLVHFNSCFLEISIKHKN